MTRKHFEAIAALLADLQNFPDATIDYDQGFRTALAVVAERLADQFQEVNPNFDRTKFLHAAGVTE